MEDWEFRGCCMSDREMEEWYLLVPMHCRKHKKDADMK